MIYIGSTFSLFHSQKFHANKLLGKAGEKGEAENLVIKF